MARTVTSLECRSNRASSASARSRPTETGSRYRQRGAFAVGFADGCTGLKTGERGRRFGGDLSLAGFPPVNGDERDAKPPGQLFLAQPETVA